MEFIGVYNEAVSSGEEPSGIEVTVIHGYGSTGEGGVLRDRLRGFLSRFGECLEFTPGEEIDGNQGCTIVKPASHLPDMNDLLAEQIFDYCERARSRSKAMGRFRRHGQPKVMEAIRSLEKQGRLEKRNRRGMVLTRHTHDSSRFTRIGRQFVTFQDSGCVCLRNHLLSY